MVRPLVVALLAVLTLAQSTAAHTPTTAIGRAVEAFGQVSVSYDPESVVSDVAAGGFPLIVGSNPKVAFMPAPAASEIAGGPNAVAAEIAREADLGGTLVVLVTELGAWSNDIGADGKTKSQVVDFAFGADGKLDLGRSDFDGNGIADGKEKRR